MEQLKQELIQVINNSNLSLEAIMFILRDLYRDVLDIYNSYKTTIKEDE